MTSGDSGTSGGVPAVSPAVSVVIPSYNRVRQLPRAIESVLRQTFADLELIVVDDGSSDGTLDYLAAIADPRLRVIRHERNQGACAARNTGIRAARAELVAFQDSDDEWLVTKLARQVEALAAADPAEYGAIYCGKLTYGESGRSDWGPRRAFYAPGPGSAQVEGDILLQLLRTPMISTQTLLVRKPLLEAIGGFDEESRIGQDWDLSVRLARITKFLFIDEPLGICFIESDSITRGKRNMIDAYRRMLDKQIDMIAAHPRLHADYLLHIARMQQRYGQYRESLPNALAALRIQPFYPRGWRAMALALLRSPFQRRRE